MTLARRFLIYKSTHLELEFPLSKEFRLVEEKIYALYEVIRRLE